MLSFTINNIPLLLSENTSVRLTWYNPFFTFREYQGDVGMGIELPVNDHNRAMLGNPERFEKHSTTNDREFTGFEVRYSGTLLMSGTLVILEPTAGGYSGWLRGNVGNIGKEYREKFIHEIDAFAENITWQNKTSYVPGTDDYCCPKIHNRQFFEDFGSPVSDQEDTVFKYRFFETTGHHVNDKNIDGSVKAVADSANFQQPEEVADFDVYVVSPMLFVDVAISFLLKNVDWYIDANAIADNATLKQWCIYNNFDITNMVLTTTGDWVENDWFDGEIIRVSAKEFNTVTRNYTSQFLYNKLLPKISLLNFILSVQNSTNTFLYFKVRNKFDILDREAILSGVPDDISDYMVGVWKIGEKKDVTLKFTFEHDENDVIFSERFENLDDRLNDIGEPVADRVALVSIASPTVGEIRYIIDEGIFSEYGYVEAIDRGDDNEENKTPMLGWKHISIGFQNGIYNSGKDQEEEIPTKLGSFVGDPPRTEQKGNFNLLNNDLNFSLRFLSNSGSAFNSLQWEGETGLLATRWPLTSRFLSTRQAVSGQAQLPLNVMDWVIRRLPYKKRAPEGEFIIEKMECEFSMKKIGTTKMEGYKV